MPTRDSLTGLVRLACSVAVWSAIWCYEPRVHAGNDDGVLVGTEAAQMAAAVTAVTSDGAATWYNPAGLANTTASTLNANLTTYTWRYIKVDDVLEGPGSSTSAKYTDWVVVPSLVSHVMKITRRFRFSYAVIVPRASNYALAITLRTPEGTRWQVRQEEHQQELDVGVGVGGHLRDNLRIGFSLFGVYNSDHLLTTAFAGNPAMPNRAVSAMSVQDANNFGFSARSGLQWDVIPELTLGIALIAPVMVVVESTNESGSLFTPASMSGGDAVQQFNRDKDTHATFSLTGTPQMRLGAAYVYTRGQVEVDSTLNFPLKDSNFDFDRKFSWNLRAGMRHKITDTFSFGVGAFTDRSPTRQEGLDFYGLAGGVSFIKVFALSRGGALNMMSSLNGRYAFGFGTASTSKVPALQDVGGDLSFDSVSSKAWINEVGISLGAGLRY